MCGLLRGSGKVMIMKLNKKDIILERKNKTVYKTDDAIIRSLPRDIRRRVFSMKP